LITLHVNGEELALDAQTHSLDTLLLFLKLRPEQVAVELNGEVIPKQEYSANLLKTGDVVEIVRFMGGGKGV